VLDRGLFETMLGGDSMEILPFDAAEKLLEIELRRGSPSLRALGRDAWARIVEAGGGEILASSAGRHVDAHVLSESSLFVRERSMSLLTCGRTELGRSLEALVERVGADVIEGVRFTREADRFPAAARTTFEADVDIIARWFEGESLKCSRGAASLRSFEWGRMASTLDFRVFCAGLGEISRHAFLEDARGASALVAGIPAVFSAEISQSHHFAPSGFSMNLARGEDVACVHVSPEASADVASVESSTPDAGLRLALLDEAERVFQPRGISVTLDGKRLMDAAEARERLSFELKRRGDARVV
jgi:S-adenosylmethionine decarboxylase